MVLVLAAFIGPVTRGQMTSSSDGLVLNQVGITAKLGERLPLDLSFVDSSGRQVRLRDFFTGRPVVLHLVYYECPMLCKLSSDGLFSALETLSLELGEDFTIVTLSFDPRETVELSTRAREMAIERCGAAAVDAGWHFLTGDQPSIGAVTEAVGFRYLFDEKTRQYAHAAGVFVLTGDGTISRYLSGIDYSPRDLRLALVEAGGGKVGTPGDQVLMLCYMYDPVSGKYGLAIMTIVRLAGLTTVAAMAAGVGLMLRRERRNAQGAARERASFSSNEAAAAPRERDELGGWRSQQ
jgi:protein SCO1/2